MEIFTSLIKRWVAKIHSSPLSSVDKIYAYKAYLEKMLLYILPTCSSNYQQCKKLDKLISPMLFNAHCIQQNCNRSVLYMSHELGGLQIFSIFHLQGVAKLQFFFKHLREMDTTRKLLSTSLRYTQLELGVSKPFLSLNFYKNHNFVTPTWITNIWQYMTECNTQIYEYEPWIYIPPRQHDFFLMDIVMRSPIPDSHKVIFNQVRINMHLLNASDIMIIDSPKKNLPSIYDGNHCRTSTYNWPTKQILPTQW